MATGLSSAPARARSRALTDRARRAAGARVLVAAYLLALVPALLLAAAQPVWSRTHEPHRDDDRPNQEHGRHPVQGRTTIQPETLALMQRTGVYSGSLPGRWPP